MSNAQILSPSLILPRHMTGMQLLRRSLADRGANLPLYIALIAVLLWVGAIALWGLPALFLPAVFIAPVMLVMLVLISRG